MKKEFEYMNGVKKHLKTIPDGVKASIGLFVANVISSGIAYITTPIYTRLLTADQFGQVSVFHTWMSIFGIIAMFNLSYGVFNNGMMEYPKERNSYSASMLILSNIISIAFAIIIMIIYPFIKSYIRMSFPLLLFMFVVFLFQPAYSFWAARQRFEYKYKLTILFTSLMSISSPLVAVICILNFDDKIAARIYGAQGVMLLFYMGFYIYVIAKAKGKINTKFWREAFFFNLPLLPHYLSLYLLNSSDRLMISHLVDDSSTAYYSVAHSVASVVTIVWSAANSSLIPYTYEKCKKKDYGAISKVAISILALFAGVCILLILFAPEVVRIMAKEEYMEAIYVIPPLIGGVFFQVQYNLFGNILYYCKKPIYAMYASVIATVLNVVLNYYLIGRFGYLAAGYTTLVCYILQAVIDFLFMKKVIGENVYDIKKIAVLSMLMLVLSLVCIPLYDKPFWIRYLLILIITGVAVFYRKKIVDLLGILKKEN